MRGADALEGVVILVSNAGSVIETQVVCAWISSLLASSASPVRWTCALDVTALGHTRTPIQALTASGLTDIIINLTVLAGVLRARTNTLIIIQVWHAYGIILALVRVARVDWDLTQGAREAGSALAGEIAVVVPANTAIQASARRVAETIDAGVDRHVAEFAGEAAWTLALGLTAVSDTGAAILAHVDCAQIASSFTSSSGVFTGTVTANDELGILEASTVVLAVANAKVLNHFTSLSGKASQTGTVESIRCACTEAGVLTRPAQAEINFLLTIGAVEILWTLAVRLAEYVLAQTTIGTGDGSAWVDGNLTNRAQPARSTRTVVEVEGIGAKAAVEARTALTGIDLDLTALRGPAGRTNTVVVVDERITKTVIFARIRRAGVQENVTIGSSVTSITETGVIANDIAFVACAIIARIGLANTRIVLAVLARVELRTSTSVL